MFATKVELFQHFLIDHQDNLIASAADSDSSADGKPKLEREIADLEKSVLGNYKVSVLEIRRGNRDNLGIISQITP